LKKKNEILKKNRKKFVEKNKKMEKNSSQKKGIGHLKNMLLLKPKIVNMLFVLTPWDRIENFLLKKLILLLKLLIISELVGNKVRQLLLKKIFVGNFVLINTIRITKIILRDRIILKSIMLLRML
jgi:hypothetical protein